MHRSHRRVRLGAAALMVLIGLPLLAGTAQGRTDDRAKPVVLVHGFDVEGNPGTSCHDTWDDLKAAFRGWGHTGPLVAVAYYEYDSGCDHRIGHHGSHPRHFGSGHYADGGHSARTDIRHLGYHLAWYLWAHFSRDGQAVDLVGHSMGGLVIRYALAQVERGHPDFPESLLVEDVVTLGTPHNGTRYALACAAIYRQCAQMRPGSGFMDWLATYAREPDGAGGTDWTTVGSQADELVSGGSANGMAACHKVTYLLTSRVRHSEYQHLTSGARTADARHRDCPDGWISSSEYWWPVRRSDLAVTFGSR